MHSELNVTELLAHSIIFNNPSAKETRFCLSWSRNPFWTCWLPSIELPMYAWKVIWISLEIAIWKISNYKTVWFCPHHEFECDTVMFGSYLIWQKLSGYLHTVDVRTDVICTMKEWHGNNNIVCIMLCYDCSLYSLDKI